MALKEQNGKAMEWSYGAVPLARNETHDRVVDLMSRENRGKVLDVPTGTGVLAGRLKVLGFEVSCCDINPVYFSVPDLTMDIGDLSRALPYPDASFDYVVCLDGIEHTENPFNTIREFERILREGGKLFLSIPNFLNLERRLQFLFTGGLSKIPSHETIETIWKNDLSMAHLSPLTYPLLKFVMEHYGFRILRLDKDRSKPGMTALWPLALLIRLAGSFASAKRREAYRWDETLSSEVLMGGNTLIVVGEKTR
jgi:SAM-dependent methyltransferase